ncbi:hypothetical protein ACVIWU_006685 [Bradyrhizobium sp. USDA 4509]
MVGTLEKAKPRSTFHQLSLGPGEYYPCMARPRTTAEDASPGFNPDKTGVVRNARATGMGQLHALTEQLEHICRVVHPQDLNLQAFGHEIRNVLILACTEVEAHWKTILSANGVQGRSTNDYFMLSEAMKLQEYQVEFDYYPWLPPVKPFERWSRNYPTQSLVWYAAYNDVKHDRESNFAKAALLRAFQAVSGCFVMLCAQHGADFVSKGDAGTRAFLRLTGSPRWPPSDIYVPALGRELKPIMYPFGRSSYHLVSLPE